MIIICDVGGKLQISSGFTVCEMGEAVALSSSMSFQCGGVFVRRLTDQPFRTYFSMWTFCNCESEGEIRAKLNMV